MSLLERLGGELELEEMIDKIYDAMAVSQDLAQFFAKHNMQVLKDRTVDYLMTNACGGFGSETYTGQDLFAAHLSLHITNRQYDCFINCSKDILKRKKEWQKVSKEVIARFEEMRTPIVDPGGKLLKALNEDLARQMKATNLNKDDEYDPTGFGMSTSKATAAKWAAAEARDKDIRARLAAVRKEREAKAAKTLARQAKTPTKSGYSGANDGRRDSQVKSARTTSCSKSSSTHASTSQSSVSQSKKVRSSRTSDSSKASEAKNKDAEAIVRSEPKEMWTAACVFEVSVDEPPMQPPCTGPIGLQWMHSVQVPLQEVH
eukprot:TRINITY_DN28503_c0_g1_i1.p1 TRINITY_DN28503_c0_g1~~TRINITY_DN28503_c0_g1_i1.p1  ORF type:complete len:317 (+),score=77.80 TRINITY_DN28503_c0_g1_i1:70-1020(+)